VESVIQDVRHGIRSLSSSPGFVLLSVLCLGLGTGATTTVFSVVNGVLLQPLPFIEPNRLVALNEIRHENRLDPGPVSYLNFRDWQEQSVGVAEMAAIGPRSLTVADGQQAERHSGALVTWNFFPLLGVQPIIGRGFRQDEDRAGGAPVVLLSEGLWQDRYAGDRAVVGRSVVVDGTPHTVVGIMPRFAHAALPGPLRAGRIWIPLTPVEHDSRRDQRSMSVYARLAAGVRPDPAATHLTTIAQAIETEHRENKGWGISLRPFAGSVSATNRALLMLIMGAVTFVLLIACANVANLMLARATGRRREIAIRAAIGASRGRIVRQLLTESLMVGVMSAPVGVMLASWGVDLLLQASAEQANNISLAIDGRVLSFTIALAILTSLVFGLAPALHAVRGATRDALSEAGRDSTASRSQKRLRNVLVVGEVALSLILLVVASLFVRSFLNLLQAEGGFDTSRLMTLRFEMPADRYDSPEALVRRVEDVVARLEALPGVESVAASNLIPLRGGGHRTTAILEGNERQVEGAVTVLYSGVTSAFFETLGVPLLHGRSFTEVEGRTRSAVAIINRRMAERLWLGQDALGKRFRLAADSSDVWFTVIGISRDISNWNLSDRPLPSAYLPYTHAPVTDPRLVIRTAVETAFTDGTARTAIHAADSALLVFALQSMGEVHRLAFWRQELLGLLLTIFGAIAMLLAAVGVYGVLSYLVSQRIREIGVRMALGADRRDVVRLIVRQGMALVFWGVVLGLAGAFAATRLIRRQLYEVSATDPVSFGAVALLLIGVGLLASYGPAYRAAGVDPIASLRD
jgi:putative ABC transport system permease protein